MSANHIRYNLAIAYQALAKLGLDDLTYTHLSARVPGEDAYYIYPFGLLFEEVTPDNLIKVSLDGQILEGAEFQYNRTGYVIHGSIYRNRSDIKAIFHLHTPEIVAVSAMQKGLQPMSQWALHFYNRIAYHDYNSLALSIHEHEIRLVRDLGDKYVMLLKHHGSITAGRTIHEAFFYTHHLQKACETQCLAMQSGVALHHISREICEKAVNDLLSFESDLGLRDWQAIQRWVGIKYVELANINLEIEW
ncbi:MAG: class II aldolase/adducin family protein [Alphaproteobacteria bacterium]|nr:class II aldolase/adducin family protein [Alphaproteobacteria bacterium]